MKKLLILALIMLSISSYLVVVKMNTNKMVVDDLYGFTELLINEWSKVEKLANSQGYSGETLKDVMCIKACSKLQFLVEQRKLIKEDFLEIYDALNLKKVDLGLYSNSNGIYSLYNYEILKFHISESKVLQGVFFSGVEKQIIQELNLKYDGKSIHNEEADKGFIKYTLDQNGKYIVVVLKQLNNQ